MKNKFYALAITLAVLLGSAVALPVPAGAANVFRACDSVAGGTAVCKEESSNKGKNPVINAMKIALEILSIIVGFAAVVLIILGGIKFMMAGGDPSSIKSGRDTVIYALIGVAVVIFAQAIVAFVLNKL